MRLRPRSDFIPWFVIASWVLLSFGWTVSVMLQIQR